MERPMRKARASVSTWNMYLYALWCADIAFWRACWLFQIRWWLERREVLVRMGRGKGGISGSGAFESL